jgi:hypothetical protein
MTTRTSVISTRKILVFYTQSTIFTRRVCFLHIQEFDTYACDYDNHECENGTHEYDLYTQSVISTLIKFVPDDFGPVILIQILVSPRLWSRSTPAHTNVI